MVDFPTDLPGPMIEGFEETLPNNIIRSEMGTGPAKTRRRSTANVRGLNMTFRFTKAEVAIFDSFYLNTISSGATAFNMEHPRTETTQSFRIVSPPKYSPMSNDQFNVSVEMEQLP